LAHSLGQQPFMLSARSPPYHNPPRHSAKKYVRSAPVAENIPLQSLPSPPPEHPHARPAQPRPCHHHLHCNRQHGGFGIFLLPASLALYGIYSLWGWGFSTVGALILAWVFSSLSRRSPNAGGPYAYPRAAFGDFAGFLIAWIYWLSILGTNAAVAVAFASYLTVFIPVLGAVPLYGGLAAIAALWALTALNIYGVHARVAYSSLP